MPNNKPSSLLVVESQGNEVGEVVDLKKPATTPKRKKNYDFTYYLGGIGRLLHISGDGDTSREEARGHTQKPSFLQRGCLPKSWSTDKEECDLPAHFDQIAAIHATNDLFEMAHKVSDKFIIGAPLGCDFEVPILPDRFGNTALDYVLGIRRTVQYNDIFVSIHDE